MCMVTYLNTVQLTITWVCGWLMLLLVFTSPVFSHFLGITLIIFISLLSTNPHLSAYCYSYLSMTVCWWIMQRLWHPKDISHLNFQSWVKCLSNFPCCSHLNTNSKGGEIIPLCTNYPPYSKIIEILLVALKSAVLSKKTPYIIMMIVACKL